MMGLTRLDRVPNQVLFARLGLPSMEELLRARPLKWLGHLARMRDGRVAKQLLLAQEVPGGARQVGRLVWADQACADLATRHTALRGRRWYKVAHNRQTWAAVVGTD